jgi:hypothetical protein
MTSIFDEYRRFAGSKVLADQEVGQHHFAITTCIVSAAELVLVLTVCSSVLLLVYRDLLSQGPIFLGTQASVVVKGRQENRVHPQHHIPDRAQSHQGRRVSLSR